MPALTPPDPMEAGGGVDAARIYADLQNDWAGFSGEEQRLILMVRELFWQADLHTNAVTLYGGSSVFCGGHVEVDDGGVLYSQWRAALDAQFFMGGERISSHTSTHAQYEIAMPTGWGTHLFGVRNGGTWFQNETYAITTTWGDYFGHVGTTVEYGGSKLLAALGVGTVQNIGAKGKSPLDDAHPLRLPAAWCNANLDALIGQFGW
ncbi:hypothetical protein AAFN86_03380 [Roseomonas sp. CAU 1739]|uniref:hypothetical protein n=1 Tax=Roseomonas sp. CAU 1739 TaxID=3140364 RepID=UPI00325B1AFF